MEVVLDKSDAVKKYVLSPTNTKTLVNSYFNMFLTRKSSSQREQNKIATNQQNNVALEAINKIIALLKNMIQKKKEKYYHLFVFNEKINLQEKINTLDGKIQDVQKDLKNVMNYKKRFVNRDEWFNR